MIKNKSYVLITFFLILGLAACSSSSGSTSTSTTTTSLSLEGELLVGTLKLENTDLAVTTDQASELLPLWEALASLADSDIASSLEVEAVVQQIKDTMSSEQITEIDAMGLTQNDLTTAANEVAATASTSSLTGSGSAGVQAAAGMGAPAGGDPNAGNAPADMGSGGASAMLAGQIAGQAQQTTTQTVSTGSTQTTNQVSVALINLVIEMLKVKTG